MSMRDEDIKRLVAELETHLAKAEASVALLKALLAEEDGEDSGGGTFVQPA